MKALYAGIKSDEWKEFMSKFAANEKQFIRLCGDDAEFMKPKNYGRILLAYLVAATPCMSGTSLRLITEDLDEKLQGRIDKGL